MNLTSPFKVAMHVHSDWSYDGKLPLSEISRLFATRGYDAVFLCEHCRTFSTSRWLQYLDACKTSSTHAILVPGIEYSDPTNTLHIPVWGSPDFYSSESSTDGLLNFLKEREEFAFGVFAHPARRNVIQDWGEKLCNSIKHIEVFNRKTDGFAPSIHKHPSIDRYPYHVAALDYHTDRQRFPIAMIVHGIDRSAEALVNAMKNGCCKSTFFGLTVKSTRDSNLIRILQIMERFRQYSKRSVRSTFKKKS